LNLKRSVGSDVPKQKLKPNLKIGRVKK